MNLKICFGSKPNWSFNVVLQFYKPQDSVYDFGEDIKLYFGLLYIHCITGLSIDSNTMTQTGNVSARELCQEHMKSSSEQVDELVEEKSNCPTRIHLGKLKNLFEVVSPEVMEVEPYTKAYLMYVFGKCLFSTTRQRQIMSMLTTCQFCLWTLLTPLLGELQCFPTCIRSWAQ